MKPQDIWSAAYNQLEVQLDRNKFNAWLKNAVYLDYESETATFVIGVHSSYACDMLQERLYRNVRRTLMDVAGRPVEIRFVLHKPAAPWPDDDAPMMRLLAQQQEPERPIADLVRSPSRPELPETMLNERFVFDRFIVNRNNQMAFEAAQAVVDYPASSYNPLLIYGTVGTGKTHLLQSIAHAYQERGRRAIYVSSEVFSHELIQAIRDRSQALFRDRYRQVDVLIVDDIQFIGGRESTEEEFFHTFNALMTFNKQIVVSTDRHPSQLAMLTDRLRSRFQGGLTVDIQPPEYETRLAILRMWLQEREMSLPRNVLEMLADRAPNNVRELEGVFRQMVFQQSIDGSLSQHRAEQVLVQFSAPRDQRLAPMHIITVTAEAFDLTHEDLVGKKRTSAINEARQVAMYLCRELTELSLPAIGDAFGGRSHTTVLHGCNNVAQELSRNNHLQAQVQRIRQQLLAK